MAKRADIKAGAQPGHGTRRKRSAGLLLVSGGKILLLRRAPGTRNARRWGLPGGQRAEGERAYAAAAREAREEMGWIPLHAVVAKVVVDRPQRRYHAFVCDLGRHGHGFGPALNEEHTGHRWVDLEWCRANRSRLHPVVRALIDDAAVAKALLRGAERAPAPIERRRGRTQIRVAPMAA